MKARIFTPTSPDEALHMSLHSLARDHVRSDSRNGPVLRFPGLVVTEWAEPTNRISWSPVRDANPFLHLIEAFWMLAGRNDVALVAKLAPQMLSYSDDGHTLYGAYGYRWRRHFGHDQIRKIIEELRTNPTSRRCVLQMWDGREELDRAIEGGRDVCCNHSISFDPIDGRLNMTVSNRSNDLVWGAYGANVVHMSVLHEYVAAQTGMGLGSYFQSSSNLHLYLENPVAARLVSHKDGALQVSGLSVDFHNSARRQETLFHDLQTPDHVFESDVENILCEFMRGSEDGALKNSHSLNLLTSMCNVFNLYKRKGPRAAVFLAENSIDSLWLESGVQWLKRRPSYAKAD